MSEQKTTVRNLALADLRGAEWNTHSKAKKSDPEFKGLVESIKKQGVIQRVVVRIVDDGGFEIVDGHRRVEAAKAARLAEVPCEVYESLDDETAQMMTATANIQRLENDPLLEAELIERMSKAGKTHKQIAAVLGKSESYITRRARLTTLTDGWRRAVSLAEEKPSVSDLEFIAAHEPELQDKVLEDKAYENGEVDWDDDFEWAFNCYMMELDEEKVGFNIDECKGCKNNTATQGDMLFPELEKETENGRCQCAECFKQKWNAATDAQIEKLRKQGVKVKEVKNRWEIPNSYSATRNKEPNHSVPYIYEEDGIRKLLWSTEKSEPVKEARTAEEIAAEKQEKKRKKILREAREAVRKRLQERVKNEDDYSFRAPKPYIEFAVRFLDRTLQGGGWFSDGMVDDYVRAYGADDVLTTEQIAEYENELSELAGEEG